MSLAERMFKGTVRDAGGGVVDVLVDGDTDVYPPIGAEVIVTYDPGKRLDDYLALIERERHCRPAEAMLADEIVHLRAAMETVASWDSFVAEQQGNVGVREYAQQVLGRRVVRR